MFNFYEYFYEKERERERILKQMSNRVLKN